MANQVVPGGPGWFYTGPEKSIYQGGGYVPYPGGPLLPFPSVSPTPSPVPSTPTSFTIAQWDALVNALYQSLNNSSAGTGYIGARAQGVLFNFINALVATGQFTAQQIQVIAGAAQPGIQISAGNTNTIHGPSSGVAANILNALQAFNPLYSSGGNNGPSPTPTDPTGVGFDPTQLLADLGFTGGSGSTTPSTDTGQSVLPTPVSTGSSSSIVVVLVIAAAAGGFFYWWIKHKQNKVEREA